MILGYNSRNSCACLYQLPNIYINNSTIYSIKQSIYQSKNIDVVNTKLGILGR